MASCLAGIPGPVDGAVVVAQPLRALRWLLRRPQALVPLALTAPPDQRTGEQLEAVARAMARNARGPMAAWWRDGHLAVSACLPTGGRRAVKEVAELGGLPWKHLGEHLAVATHPGLLDGSPIQPPPLPEGRSSALVLTRNRTWSVTIQRSGLKAVSGSGAESPPANSRASRLATSDAGALLDLLGVPAPPGRYPVCLAFGRVSGWGLMMPEEYLGYRVARFLGSPGRGQDEADSPPAPWDGLLGRVWHARKEDWVVIASEQDLVDVLRQCDPDNEWGHVAGDDLSYLIEQIAAVGRTIGVGSRVRRTLDTAVEGSSKVRSSAWQMHPEGGVLTIEW